MPELHLAKNLPFSKGGLSIEDSCATSSCRFPETSIRMDRKSCIDKCFLLILAVAMGSLESSPARAQDQLFDEFRFGVSTSVQGGRSGEDGAFPELTVLFDPFGYEAAGSWREQLLLPRVHLGTSIGSSGEATQFFTGFTWTVDFSDKVFAEAGFGGVIHTGDLDGNDGGPNLGCRVLFHEYVGGGYRLTEHWNLSAQIAHSSNANLCSPNDGMTRAGLQVGYKF